MIVVRSHNGALNTHFRAMPSPMGIALGGSLLAVGTRAQVEIFQNQAAVTKAII